MGQSMDQMLYGNGRTAKQMEFLQKVDALCAEYGYVIGHQDFGGAFEIFSREINKDMPEWFLSAGFDRTAPR